MRDVAILSLAAFEPSKLNYYRLVTPTPDQKIWGSRACILSDGFYSLIAQKNRNSCVITVMTAHKDNFLKN